MTNHEVLSELGSLENDVTLDSEDVSDTDMWLEELTSMELEGREDNSDLEDPTNEELEFWYGGIILENDEELGVADDDLEESDGVIVGNTDEEKLDEPSVEPEEVVDERCELEADPLELDDDSLDEYIDDELDKSEEELIEFAFSDETVDDDDDESKDDDDDS